MALTGKQKRHLRGLGHHLKPIVIVGRAGITDNLITTVKATIAAHELIKVKIGNGCLLDRQETAETLAAKTDSEVAQVMGKTLLLFRANSDLEGEDRIKLPA